MRDRIAIWGAGGFGRYAYDIQENNYFGYAEDTGLRLSGAKLAALGWRPEESLEMMYRDLVESMIT